MTPPTNQFTVTVADAHSNSVQQGQVPAATKIDAARTVLAHAECEPALLSALVPTDTWTITITQP